MNTYSHFELASRHWQSEHIRGYTLALARSGCPDALALLVSLEPLDTIREDSAEGVLLWAAFSEMAGLPCVAQRAMVLARGKWPRDVRLLGTQKERAT